MTLPTLAACVGILGALQVVYMFLKNMEAAAKQVDGPEIWTAADGTMFEEVAVGELEAARMKREFDLARAKSIMTSATEYAVSKA